MINPLRQVEPPLVVVAGGVIDSSSNTDLNFYNNTVVDDPLNSMISSGSRVLGGYSLSLLSNNNLAQSSDDVGSSPHQAPQLSGTKRLRPYSIPPSIPKRRTSSFPPNSDSLPFAGSPADSSQTQFFSTSTRSNTFSLLVCHKAIIDTEHNYMDITEKEPVETSNIMTMSAICTCTSRCFTAGT